MELQPQTWLEVVDALYADAWNPGIQRFRSPFAFRGLARADHDLTSSLRRLASGHHTVEKIELHLLRNFRKYAYGQAAEKDSVWHWLALGQHRGLPTRLLDWTYSPLVALHFATDEPADFEDDGVIWCVNFVEANKRLPRRLKHILEEEGSETLTVEMLMQFPNLRAFDRLSRNPFVVFVEPPSLDPRILNQFALFSLMPSATARLDEWLEDHPELFRRVRLPAALKWEIRDKLDQANVNERILFPGLDGLTRWLARYYLPRSARLKENLLESPVQPPPAALTNSQSGKRGRRSSRTRRPATTRQ